LILEKAVALMKNTDYKFCIEQIFLLEAIEKRNPKLWSELKEMIKQGKLEIVDGQYLMPDAMLPDGETLVREILYGKNYCRRKFKVDVPVAWAADGFGLNAQIPQIYKKAGYKWLAFQRGALKQLSEFLWKGLDGTVILAHWMPLGYRAGLELEKIGESYNALKKLAVTSHILMPSGSGVTIPQEETVEVVDKWNKEHEDVKIKIATPSDFFKAIQKDRKVFQTLTGEMYSREYSEVFPDTGSSRVWMIIGAKKCEQLIKTTEKFRTIVWLMGQEYPAQDLEEAWKKLLFIAFHDMITGCGIDEIYQEAREYFSDLDTKLNKLLHESLNYIAEQIDTDGESIVVFNPLSWKVVNWVEANIELQDNFLKNPGLKDKEEICSDILTLERYESGYAKKARLGFTASVPPLGYKVYKLIERSKKPEGKLRVDKNEVENSFFKVRVDEKTGIIEVYKKDSFLFGGNELVLEDESGDLYFHNSRLSKPVKAEGGEGFRYGDFKPKSFRIDKGSDHVKIIFEEEFYCLRWPYRLMNKLKPLLYRHKRLDIEKEVIVYSNIPRIEFITKISNQYPNVRIRVRFNTPIKSPNYSRETQFGVIDEQIMKHITFKEKTVELPYRAPCINWIDYSDRVNGVALINRGTTENEISKDALYMTLLRSVSCLSADGESGPLVPTPDALELRDYTFNYAVYPHSGDWKGSDLIMQAYEYNNPLIPIQARSKGKLPKEFSFMTINPAHVVISALKKAENGDDVILRFFDIKGEKSTAEIKLYKAPKEVATVDLLERNEENISGKKDALTVEVKPFEIITLKLKFAG